MLYSDAEHWYQRMEWTNTIFLIFLHIMAAVGVWVLIAFDNFQTPTIILTVIMGIITGLSITGGYHRLFSHKTYQSNWIVRLIWILFGAAAFQNSAFRWSSDHRRHHKYVDTENDPYNIKEGFLFAHMGWVFLKYADDHKYDDVPDLEKDPLVMFQHNHYVPLSVGMGLLLPTLIASLWGDPIGGFFMAGWIRIILNEHFTFSINSFSHYFGTQPYNDSDTSRDNWFFAFFSYGEGYHNYHHKFPFDYRNGIKHYQWDPTKWVIKALSWIGWTKGLKRAPNEAILQARLKMDEKRILSKLETKKEELSGSTRELISTARIKLEKAYVQFQKCKRDYAQFRRENLKALNEQLSNIHENIARMKEDVVIARQSLESAAKAWVKICDGFGISPTRAAA